MIPDSQKNDRTHPKVICLGELIIDFISEEPGKKLPEIEKFRKSIGGAPANVAIGLHYHNVPSILWSKVGEDSFGQFLKDRLQKMGLDSGEILTDATHPTKLAFVAIDESGERTFEFHNRDSAEKYIRLDEINRSQLQTARIFHFGGVALLGDITSETTFSLLAGAKNAGCMVSFDPNIRLDLCGNPDLLMPRIEKALPFVDILKLSQPEFDVIFSDLEPSELLNRGISLLIITRGAQGSRFFTHHSSLQIPAMNVRVADTTGAGDAFSAALLSRLRNISLTDLARIPEKRLLEIGQFAAAWAGRIISMPGAVSAYFAESE
ncbi:MAG: carbohydrate kinase [Calditrichia bacterium]